MHLTYSFGHGSLEIPMQIAVPSDDDARCDPVSRYLTRAASRAIAISSPLINEPIEMNTNSRKTSAPSF